MMVLIFVAFLVGHSCLDYNGNNNKAVLISKYAKVSHWTPNFNASGPTRIGQSLWTYRSDANVQGNRHRVAAQYPAYKRIETVPAVGEVIQDRSSYKPHFHNAQPQTADNSISYLPPKPAAPVRQAPPPSVNTFPAVFNVAPKGDSYSSSYSSYNPANHRQSSDDVLYPPLDSPPTDNKGYPDAGKEEESPMPTLGPPLSPDFEGPMVAQEVDAPPSDHHQMSSHGHGKDGPPDHPPRSETDVYYPDDAAAADGAPADHAAPDSMDQMPPDSMDQMPSDSMDQMPPDSMDQMPAQPGMMMMMDQTKDMGMDQGKDMPPDDHSFPHYLYDNPHFDHHVYEEIPHTTTQATEDKRVSSTHYSYYYLGRKLWYIPLYFSIYFMVYVTILILKAIARHKVELKNDWASSHSRSARKMTFDQMRNVDEIHRNVTKALDRASRSYSNIAM